MHFIKDKRFVMSLMFFLALNHLCAQQDSSWRRRPPPEPPNKWLSKDRFFWGGNVGASFGYITFIDLSPLIGYKVTDKLSFGVGAIYNYYSYKYGNYKYSANFYGGRIYGRYFVLQNVFLQAGWDHINRNDPYSFNPDARVWIDNLLVGGGLRYPVTDNLYMVGSLLYNLNQTPLSPYGNPIVQIGFVGAFR